MSFRIGLCVLVLGAISSAASTAVAADAKLSLNDGTFLPGGVFGGTAATDPLSISHTLIGSLGGFSSAVFGSADIPSGQVDIRAQAQGSTTGGSAGMATITDRITITGGTPGVAVPITLEFVVAGEFQMAASATDGGASIGNVTATLGGTGALFVDRYRQFDGNGQIINDSVTPSGPAADFFEPIDLDHFAATLSKTSMVIPGNSVAVTAYVSASTGYHFPVTAKTTGPAQLVILTPPDVGFTSQSGALLTAPEPTAYELGVACTATLCTLRRDPSRRRRRALVRD